MNDHASHQNDATSVPGRMSRPAPRLAPLPPEHSPELAGIFKITSDRLGFIPNRFLTMQRKPKMVKAFGDLVESIFGPDGVVDPKTKQLVAFMVSHASGCQYCVAHTGSTTARMGIPAEKLEAIWDYQSSHLFNDAERAALDVAVASGCIPNEVTDDMFANLRAHWRDDQIVEIIGVIGMFGFLNRWNDTFATPLEAEPIAFGRERLGAAGWTPDKHIR
jgi:uncharacterized peroxidase-related enzyme